uniref:Variant surface glycoprotein 1125.1217 n=1 Tax=Trypanosoma brucei TaxID=5691 RepID=A0A1J0R6I7_9TRYP|nr:variant surface glycoprotein 1125.1217 [Trypanosoma brucei]
MNIALVAALATTLAYLADAADEPVNGPEFNVLCSLTTMIDTEELEELEEAAASPDAATAWQEIQRLYILTANESYYKTGPPKDSQGAKSIQDSDAAARAWESDRRKWEDNTKETDGKTKKYRRPDRKAMSAATIATIDKLYTLAEHLHTAYESTATEIAEQEKLIRQATRKALLNKATEGTAETKVTTESATESDFKASYSAACNTAGGPGQHLANDLLCLCSAGTGNGQTSAKMCTLQDNAEMSTDPYDNQARAATIYKKLAAECKKLHPTTTVSATAIAAQLSSWRTLLGRYTATTHGDKGEFSLGKPDGTGGCDGTAASDKSCVNYAVAVKNGGTKNLAKAVQWYAQLTTAQSALTTRRQLNARKHRQQTRLLALWDQMEQLYTATLHPTPIQNPTAGANTPGATADKSSICKLKNSTEEECPSQHCDYNKEKEECKPKETGKAKTAKGTG